LTGGLAVEIAKCGTGLQRKRDSGDVHKKNKKGRGRPALARKKASNESGQLVQVFIRGLGNGLINFLGGHKNL